MEVRRWLYSWGANSYGQLGQGHTEDLSLPRPTTPSQVSGEDGAEASACVEFVRGGGGHSVAVLPEGNVAVCGLNDRGQLGIGKCETRQRQRSRRESERRKMEASAIDSSCSRTKDDAVDDAVGSGNVDGSLAAPKSICRFTRLPTDAFLSHRVEIVACGWDHTLAKSSTGALFSWGSNVFGQLGLSTWAIQSASLPQRVLDTDRCIHRDSRSSRLDDDAPSGILGGVEVTPVVTAIACGLRHSVIATLDGCVMTCGAGRSGQLGFDASDVTTTAITTTTTTTTAASRSSAASTRVPTASRGIGKWFRFTCVKNVGEMDAGTTGGGEENDGKGASRGERGIERPSVSSAKLISVFAGSFHSGVLISNEISAEDREKKSIASNLTTSTALYSWGCNKYGQLGRDPKSLDRSPLPLRLSTTDDAKNDDMNEIEEVASGWTHVVVRNRTGKVYSWGRNCYGQLGRASSDKFDFVPASIRFPVSSPPSPDGGLRSEGDVGSPFVTSIRCGSEHSLALTRDGSLYSFGWNEHGSCGGGDEVDQRTPLKVEIPAGGGGGRAAGGRWLQIGSGYGHSFAVGTTG